MRSAFCGLPAHPCLTSATTYPSFPTWVGLGRVPKPTPERETEPAGHPTRMQKPEPGIGSGFSSALQGIRLPWGIHAHETRSGARFAVVVCTPQWESPAAPETKPEAETVNPGPCRNRKKKRKTQCAYYFFPARRLSLGFVLRSGKRRCCAFLFFSHFWRFLDLPFPASGLVSVAAGLSVWGSASDWRLRFQNRFRMFCFAFRLCSCLHPNPM